ncbi:hypothetical protein [Methanosarcina sp. KYL-1]|nr:hypothetical protein [Methanosarcina sp. KYL-1]
MQKGRKPGKGRGKGSIRSLEKGFKNGTGVETLETGVERMPEGCRKDTGD